MFTDIYLKVDSIDNLAQFILSRPCVEITTTPLKDYLIKWKLYLEIAKSLTDANKGEQNESIYSQSVDLPNLTSLIYNLSNGKVSKSFFEYKKDYLEHFVRDHHISTIANIFEHVFGEKGSRSTADLAEQNLAKITDAFDEYGDDKIKDMIENYKTVYDYIRSNLNLKPFVERVIKENPQEPCVKNYLKFFTSPDMVINSLFNYKYLEPLIENIEKNYGNWQNNDDFNGLFIGLE